MSVACEDLGSSPRILWQRVATRRAATEGKTLRFASGRISGRPPKSETRNLLAGLATCGVCGGGLIVETSSRKGSRAHEYVCARRRQNGSCANALRLAATVVNEAVLQAIEAHALTPEAVEAVIPVTERDDQRERQVLLAREQEILDPPDCPADRRDCGRRRRAAGHTRTACPRIAACRPIPRLPVAVLADRLAEWRRLLRQSTTQARAVLQRVLDGRVTFTPEGPGYAFAAPTRYDRLFSGLVAPHPAFVPESTEGWAHLTPEDTPEADYGQMLERAYDGKGLASPRGFETFCTVERERFVPAA